ncbi:MAG: hypothetical protein L0H73_15525, partial [Nitrococcus sp.]|nr:hypothetical protein [Nitrococcus sp.]
RLGRALVFGVLGFSVGHYLHNSICRLSTVLFTLDAVVLATNTVEVAFLTLPRQTRVIHQMESGTAAAWQDRPIQAGGNPPGGNSGQTKIFVRYPPSNRPAGCDLFPFRGRPAFPRVTCRPSVAETCG